jgi:leader peptidase (prepilin peptidase) / N-methyltransferase
MPVDLLFPPWTVLIGFFIGAAVGSFLNVVIYRTPRNLSLHTPSKSFCPRCKHSLGVPDLIPLFSYLLSGRKCRYCHAPIAGRYFFVELVTATVWAAIWFQYLVLRVDPVVAIGYFFASAVLIAIVFIDWELYIIPESVNASLSIVGILFNVGLYAVNDPRATTWGIPSSLAGWIVGVLALWGIAFIGRVLLGRDSMGHGDIKMARGIGAVLFPAMALVSFGLAVVVGAVLGAAQILLRGRPAQGADAGAADEEEELPPESIGSLVKCGIGYLLGVDIVGLVVPRLYEWWFGEPSTEPFEEVEDFEVEHTMIPFGPYLALGAIVTMLFQDQLAMLIAAYWNWAMGPAG